MPSYRIEEKIAGTNTWRRVDHPAAIGAQAFGTGRSRTIYSTMRAAALDCREIHDKNCQDDHRVVEIGYSKDSVAYWIPVMDHNLGNYLELEDRARILRRDLTGTLVTDEWSSPSERDLHIQAVLNVRRRP